MQLLATAATLKQELDTLRPLNTEDEQRIMQKFRLDWNYHSNHLEGNSLTYGETKALILFGVTAGGKPLRDTLEMSGHNEVLKWIEEIVKEEQPLTENFIRQSHELILKEDYQVDAITPDGKPTKKWVRIGKYKTEPNHVKTVTGEMFYFANPEETPAQMHDLLDWYRKKAEDKDVSPITLAAQFHYRFIRIHPFDDGNGRTARILMNFILMQFGYPPAIIRTEDKENYFAVLRQADAGVLEPFVEYIATNVIRSLEMMIKGAKGESIEELDDLDKELALLEQKLISTKQKIKNERDSKKARKKENILGFYQNSVLPLFDEFFVASMKFNRFYFKSNFTIEWIIIEEGKKRHTKRERSGKTDFKRILNEVQQLVTPLFNRIVVSCYHYSLKGPVNPDHEAGMSVTFHPQGISVSTFNGEMIEKIYSQQLTEEEINRLVKSEAKRHKEVLEQKIKEIETANTEHRVRNRNPGGTE